MFWENKVQSGIVLAGGSLFYLIVHVFDYPLISLVAWCLLVVLALALVAKVATYLCTKLGYPVHPLLLHLQRPVVGDLVQEDALVARAKELTNLLNLVFKQWNTVLAFDDVILSFKVAAALFVVASFFQVMSVQTLIFLTFFFGMTLPHLYFQNQTEVDAFVSKALTEAKTKSSEVYEQVKSQYEPAKVKVLDALTNAKTQAFVFLHQNASKLPAPYAEKIAPYFATATVSVPVAEDKKKSE